MQLALEMHFCRGVQLVVVDAQHAGQVGTVLGRSAEDHPLGTGPQVGVVAGLELAVFFPFATGEKAGAFDDHVDLQVAPGELGRVAFGQGPDFLAVDDDVFVVEADLAGITAVGAVVFEQHGQRFVVGQIVDGDDLELRAAAHQIPEHQPADPAKTVNRNANCHGHFSFNQSQTSA